MSRICGVVDFGGASRSLDQPLSKMAATMRHSSEYAIDSYNLGAAALANIEFGAGSNFSSVSRDPSGQSVCLCAGYITDLSKWREQILRDSNGTIRAGTPADVIFFQLSTYGSAGLKDINGTFAFAIWNNSTRTLQLGADRLGMRPLYVLRRGSVVKFASEPKAIALTESGLHLDSRSLEDLVVLSLITGDRTVYTEIERVPIGTVVTFQESARTQERYWWFDQLRIDEKMTVPEFIDESEAALKRAVNRLTPLCEKKICTLSSGNDSRRIFLELVGGAQPFSVFTAAVPLKGSQWESDSVISKALCDEFKIPHHRTDFYDPRFEARLAAAAFSLLDHETDQHRWALPMIQDIPLNCGINFDGFGGDIYVYDTSLVAHLLGDGADNRKLAQHLITFNYGLHEREFLKAVQAESVLDRHTACMKELPQDDNRNSNWFSALWARRRTAPFSMALMSLKVESVFPYLDNEVVEVSMKLSPKLKVDRDLQFEILQHQYPDLMRRIPTSGYPHINNAPDAFAQTFVRAIPANYYDQKSRAYLGVVARQIARSGRLRRMVSSNALLGALTVGALSWTKHVPPTVLRSAWRLRSLGLIADLVCGEDNSGSADNRLEAARGMVFNR